ncbi:DUF3263 domain-containing protein [Brachybacterium sp.]|uniref:DUF3263 domain-containing protein n=1 Tax=Brachybacterium sp. TaxID=1891286 RepID=UPI002ED537C6
MPADPAPAVDPAAAEHDAVEPSAADGPPADAAEGMSDASLPGPQGGLSAQDRRILALEGRTFRYVGAKERAIREELGISKVAYYVRLNSLLDEPAALRAAPSLIHRLRGRRTSEDGAPEGAGAAEGTHRVA